MIWVKSIPEILGRKKLFRVAALVRNKNIFFNSISRHLDHPSGEKSFLHFCNKNFSEFSSFKSLFFFIFYDLKKLERTEDCEDCVYVLDMMLMWKKEESFVIFVLWNEIINCKGHWRSVEHKKNNFFFRKRKKLLIFSSFHF